MDEKVYLGGIAGGGLGEEEVCGERGGEVKATWLIISAFKKR